MEEEYISKILLQTLYNIARDLKEMRHNIGFCHEASTSTSYGMEHSAAPKCSTIPSFLFLEHKEETLGNYFEEYESQSQRFKEHLSFQEFCQIKDGMRVNPQQKEEKLMQGSALQHSMVRLFLPTFDGTCNFSTKAWAEKLGTYFQLNKVSEIEAIKIDALHLEGEAQKWWFNGLATLGHHHITSYLVFTKSLVERFDPRDPKAHFVKLTKLK